MRIAINSGDVFSVPLDQDSCCLGVVASTWKGELYIVLFQERFAASSVLVEIDIAGLTPFLASSSLDAKLHHGHWSIVRRNAPLGTIAQPVYKVVEPEGLVVESFDRTMRWSVNPDVADRLDFRKGVAPVRLEKALKAHHGLGEWELHFDELLYTRILRSNAILRESGVKPSSLPH